MEKTAKTTFSQKAKDFFAPRNLAVMAILSALSFVLYMFVKFPLPFMFPGFLDMQFSDLPALLGGFALGPTAGGTIIVVKCLIKMPFSSTACVGELADLIVGLCNVVPAALFYKYHKSKKGALVSLLIGAVCAIAAALVANRFILVPFYAKTFGMDAIIKMVSSLYPEATAENFYAYYLPLAVLPFNALRCILCGVITYFTYKPLSKALHWERSKKEKDGEKNREDNAVTKADGNLENKGGGKPNDGDGEN